MEWNISDLITMGQEINIPELLMLLLFEVKSCMGGDWGAAQGIDESALPATYEIDYVRVYQK